MSESFVCAQCDTALDDDGNCLCVEADDNLHGIAINAVDECNKLRAELAAMTKRADELHKFYDDVLDRAEKAEAERDEARAELARLTTLRMGPRGCLVCGIGKQGEAMGYVCPRMDCPIKATCGWTPLPDVKETTGPKP
jgi:hypothetical protein